ncbi:polypeptide N-acetylgalactosaminyltransferase 18-like [Petromyzon marinus]|uniref:polypeptide N-acetylgalactosaminyltransferase 18-like n=1 Tax=Petromyzon marinus TaxID=7757 RepID=UPI003F70337B
MALLTPARGQGVACALALTALCCANAWWLLRCGRDAGRVRPRGRESAASALGEGRDAGRGVDDRRLGNIERLLESLVRATARNNSEAGGTVEAAGAVCPGNELVDKPAEILFKEWGKGLPAWQKRAACARFLTYGYNAYLSDRLPLDRDVPDNRPPGCSSKRYPSELPALSLVLIFYNEAVSILLRAVTSAVRNTPHHLLKEIILVDDCSDYADLQEGFRENITQLQRRYEHVSIRLVRHAARRGLSASRVTGIRAASGPVVAVMDAHVEFPVGWAEPILGRLAANRRLLLSPVFDNTHYDSLRVQHYTANAQAFNWELWCAYLKPPADWVSKGDPTAPIRSPIVMGCMAASKSYLEEIGFLDEGMQVYGGENVELGLRVWQCGGSVEVLPCSRLAHIERYFKPYAPDLSVHMRRNALRVAEIWMDDFKRNVYMAWNVPMNGSGIDIGDISERVALRKRLNCKSFAWYLENVLPSLPRHDDIVQYGVMKNEVREDLCLDQGSPEKKRPILYPCHIYSTQRVCLTAASELLIGDWSLDLWRPKRRCLVEVEEEVEEGRESGGPALIACSLALQQRRRMHWKFTQDGEIRNTESGNCLEVTESTDDEQGLRLVVRRCSRQRWHLGEVGRVAKAGTE